MLYTGKNWKWHTVALGDVQNSGIKLVSDNSESCPRTDAADVIIKIKNSHATAWSNMVKALSKEKNRMTRLFELLGSKNRLKSC